MPSVRERLRDCMDAIPIIDAHEHLRPETVHLQSDYSFFHLFVPYVMYDLYSAGMPRRWLDRPPKGENEVEACWEDVEPVWRYVKHGSFARSMLRALKEFWNVDDITDANYREIGELLNATRQPGHYRRVLVEKCGLEWVLNQTGHHSYEEPFMRSACCIHNHLRPDRIADFGGEEGCIEAAKAEMRAAKAAGAVQVKFDVSIGLCETDTPGRRVGDALLSFLPELDMVAAVHTGVWHDIRDQNPEHLFSFVAAHPDVTFDVYHMGIPYARECGFLSKNYPNAYLNLCWSHIISPEMVVRTLGEWLDYVPTNKVFGFGGDFLFNPEQTWGALQIAKDNLAEVFARKVEQGVMGIDDAEEILRLWLLENPARIYRLTA